MRRILNSRGVAFVAGVTVAATMFLLGGARSQSTLPIDLLGHDSIPIDQPVTGIDQEPILFWDVSGFGFGGPLHERLAVYSDGLVTYAFSGSGDDGSACFSYVPRSAVHQLADDLKSAGADTAPDNPQVILDVPVTTITTFRHMGHGQALAHTFSFWAAMTPTSVDVSNVVQEFKQNYLPAGGCDGSGG